MPRKQNRLLSSKAAMNTGRSESSPKPTRCGAMRKNPNNDGARRSAISEGTAEKGRKNFAKHVSLRSIREEPHGPTADGFGRDAAWLWIDRHGRRPKLSGAPDCHDRAVPRRRRNRHAVPIPDREHAGNSRSGP